MISWLTCRGRPSGHVESLLAQLGEAQSLIEIKEGLERDAADEIASLSQALLEEQNLRVNVEDTMDALLESHNLNIASLIKERDHARALVKVLKIEKAEFDVGHARLLEDLENLDKAHKALKSELSSSSKSLDQPQGQPSTQLNKDKSVVILTNPCCKHGDVLEENIKLKAELEKCLATQKATNGKEGLGNPSKPKKRKNRRKKKSMANVQKVAGTSGEGRGGTSGRAGVSAPKGGVSAPKAGVSTPRAGVSGPTSKGYAGANNPNYSLRRNYYGDLYAVYTGPYDGYVSWSIWVPKTLCTNMRGPIAKQWVPKSKN